MNDPCWELSGLDTAAVSSCLDSGDVGRCSRWPGLCHGWSAKLTESSPEKDSGGTLTDISDLSSRSEKAVSCG